MFESNKIVQKLISLIFWSVGSFLCLFVSYFVVTGFDEIWNGGKVWFLGIGIAGLLLSIGFAMISIAISKKRRASKYLMIAIIVSFVFILLGLMQI